MAIVMTTADTFLSVFLSLTHAVTRSPTRSATVIVLGTEGDPGDPSGCVMRGIMWHGNVRAGIRTPALSWGSRSVCLPTQAASNTSAYQGLFCFPTCQGSHCPQSQIPGSGPQGPAGPLPAAPLLALFRLSSGPAPEPARGVSRLPGASATGTCEGSPGELASGSLGPAGCSLPCGRVSQMGKLRLRG